MTGFKTRLALATIIVVSCITLFIARMNDKTLERRPTRYLLPAGFTGLAQIHYGIPMGPPLPEEDGYRLIQVPPTGLVVTSSEFLEGTARDEFLWISKDDARQPIPMGYHQTWIHNQGNGAISGCAATQTEHFIVAPPETSPDPRTVFETIRMACEKLAALNATQAVN